MVEIEVIPISYITNGATRLAVRVVGDLLNYDDEVDSLSDCQFLRETYEGYKTDSRYSSDSSLDSRVISKGFSYSIVPQIDLEAYRPRIQGDIWYLSEIDLNFLMDGTGILGVGSCGEPYPTYLACLQALRNGEEIKIQRQDTLADDAIILPVGFIVMYLLSSQIDIANRYYRDLQACIMNG